MWAWTGRRLLQCQCPALPGEDGAGREALVSQGVLGRDLCPCFLEAPLGSGIWRLVFGQVGWLVATLSRRPMAPCSGPQRNFLHGMGWRIGSAQVWWFLAALVQVLDITATFSDDLLSFAVFWT